jgi:hypothetical protein
MNQITFSGGEFPDVGLFAKKAVAFGLRDDDMANTGKPGNQPALDVAPDLHNRNAQVNGRFFNFESAPVAKGNLGTGAHDANTNTPN